MGKDNKLYVPLNPVDECAGCNNEIVLSDFYDGKVFITIEDRSFHQDCWEAHLLDNECSRML